MVESEPEVCDLAEQGGELGAGVEAANEAALAVAVCVVCLCVRGRATTRR